MKFSKIILLSVSLLAIVWPIYASEVLIKPNFFDPRFEPADKLHAGCENSIDVNLYQIIGTIKDLKLELEYDADDMEIISLTPINGDSINSDFTMEYWKIIYRRDNFKSNNLFRLSFKSNADITWSVLKILGTSYLINETNNKIWLWKEVDLEFASVSECNPDTAPPWVKLIQPRNIQDPIPQDMFFVRDIRPLWKNEKWVDKASVVIDLNWTIYSWASNYLKRSWSYLSFYPAEWLPVNWKVSIKVYVQDKQVYWWPNKTEKIFTFKTSTGLTFRDYISPNKFRSLVYQTQENIGWDADCDISRRLYMKSDSSLKSRFKSILTKLWCAMPSDNEIELYMENSMLTKKDAQVSDALENMSPWGKNVFISVFAAIWRILFSVTLFLKVNYLIWYRFHKKKHEYYKDLVCEK